LPEPRREEGDHGRDSISLFLFVVGHLLDNLQVFAGAERLNAYSAFLKRTEEILWAVRLVAADLPRPPRRRSNVMLGGGTGKRRAPMA
jgi:hypothetical protein